jgi:hypothetical protein
MSSNRIGIIDAAAWLSGLKLATYNRLIGTHLHRKPPIRQFESDRCRHSCYRIKLSNNVRPKIHHRPKRKILFISRSRRNRRNALISPNLLRPLAIKPYSFGLAVLTAAHYACQASIHVRMKTCELVDMYTCAHVVNSSYFCALAPNG